MYRHLAFLLLFVIAQPACAELPSIRFDRIAPLGATAGTTVEVEIAGADIEEIRALWFDHAGLSAEPVSDKERFFNVTIALTFRRELMMSGLSLRWGISNPRLFAVSHGLQNVAETEPNNDSTQAQAIDINSAVGGMSDGNGQDLFRFAATTGQRIVIDCQAGLLDSSMDATMSLMSESKLLASSSDYRGRDPFIDFLVPRDGEYQILVHDLSYRGGLPYRLLVTDRPYVENIFPRAVQAGKPAELTAFGRNFPADSPQSQWQINDLPVQQHAFTVDVPSDVLQIGGYQFFEHPSGHSVLPTAATCTLTGFQVQPMIGTNVVSFHAQTLLMTDSPVSLEAEPNDDSTKPQPLTLPAVVSGRFDRPRDADWFELEVAESGQYAFDVYCERIDGGADPYLVVVDDQGNRVQELDDFGHRINAFDGHLRDPAGMVNLNDKRKYKVLVQDRYQRGGARYQYVLTIRKPQPDFYPAVIHSQNPGPGGTNLWRGGAVYLDAVIHQRDGFNEEITFTAEGLPPGVHCVPMVINNNSRGTFILWADDDAADFTGPIQIIATAKRGDETLRREVRAYTRVDSGTNSSQAMRSLVIAVRDGAPYRLEWDQQSVEADAGKTIDLKLRLTRRISDWKDEVTIQPLAFPGNFTMSNGGITGDQADTTVNITVQAGTRPGQYTLAILGQSQVPFSKDATATDRPNTLVSLPSQPITIKVKPIPAAQ
ncbi:MAG: PPC domain-containing protein [Planctomycetaceae bacterium]